MTEQSLARLKQGMDELEGEWVALECAVVALTLEICATDKTAIERIHRVFMAYASVERRRGSGNAEGRASAIEVLADRLLLAARGDPGPNSRSDAAP